MSTATITMAPAPTSSSLIMDDYTAQLWCHEEMPTDEELRELSLQIKLEKQKKDMQTLFSLNCNSLEELDELNECEFSLPEATLEPTKAVEKSLFN